MHGTTMVFFVGMPILIGIGNYLVPLMIGARDMAFPRLNALGFWATLFGGLLVYFSFATGGAPALGWFAYAPLTETDLRARPGDRLLGAGPDRQRRRDADGGRQLHRHDPGMRAPGMAVRKMPFFCWTMLWTSVQILLAIPPLTAALVMILLDRQLGAHFFDAQNGGSAYLWQHLFWFFGHPEVYILILPVFGMISEVIPVFSRKVLFGYEFMAVATMAIAFISLGVWAHHMFTVGMSRTLDLYFVAASLLVSIPTGIKFFNWLATMYGGRISFASPMLFACGFLSLFLIGGLTGIMLAAAPFDFQLSRQLLRGRPLPLGPDRRHAVRHLRRHPLLVSQGRPGRMLSERLARWQFWLLYIGFILTFGPMHVAGMLGMPRRIYTYERRPGLGRSGTSSATLGAILQVPSFAIFVVNLVVVAAERPAGGRRPLGRLDAGVGDDLAAARRTTSRRSRRSHSRRPLWDLKHPDDPDWTVRVSKDPRRERIDSRCDLASPPSCRARPEPGQWGMIAFLVSEVAFFSTLIVAYLTFLGKDTVGPTPREALSLPLVIGTTICLLSSSVTIHLAEGRLRLGDAGGIPRLVGGHDRAGRRLPAGHGLRVVRADRAASADDQPQPVRHHVSTPWSASMACT